MAHRRRTRSTAGPTRLTGLAGLAAVAALVVPLGPVGPVGLVGPAGAQESAPARGGVFHDLDARGEAGPVVLAPGTGITLLHVSAVASKSAAGKSQGTFSARGRLRLPGASHRVPVSFSGPVRCLRVRGGTVSIAYPVTSVTPRRASSLFTGKTIAVTFREANARHGAEVGFLPPQDTASFAGCPAARTVLDFDGRVHFA